MKFFEVYTNQMHEGMPFILTSMPVESWVTSGADDLYKGVANEDGKRVIGDGDQWVNIAGIIIQRKNVIYVREVEISEEVKANE